LIKSSVKSIVSRFMPTLFLSVLAILATVFSVITALNFDGDNREKEEN